MEFLNIFNEWKNDSFFDETTKSELSVLDETKDINEIEDRFYRNLEFGTAGLRGVMGAGTNRMNKYVVGKATKGYANYLLSEYGAGDCRDRGVVVAFDTRNNSKEFAQITANVFSAMGVKVYLHKNPVPIPELSFSIKKLNAIAGVVLTASHNTKEYNGYKIYDEFGCQLVPDKANKVTAFVDAVTSFKEINFDKNSSLIDVIDMNDEFVDEVLKQSRFRDKDAKSSLRIVYTPIHGSGLIPVSKVLEKDGFNVHIVKSQAEPNGDFPTVSAPNPENKQALELGIKDAEQIDADLVIGTDPDCDRVGVAVKTDNGYNLITGNQMGALLVDFVVNNTDFANLSNPVVIKSIVSSELAFDIAKKHNIKTMSVLTGFKFIGDKITQFEKAKQQGDAKNSFDFLFGFEESYGYLIGTHAQDKDAVVSSMIIAEMTAKYKNQGKTLIDRLNEIYKEFGFYLDTQDSFTLKGKEGLEKIQNLMKSLRENESPFDETKSKIDFLFPNESDEELKNLPKADVLKYILNDGTWIAIRPSGTEPKIKIYYSIKGDSEIEANEKLQSLQSMIKSKLGL